MKNIFFMIKKHRAKWIFFIATAACFAAILTVSFLGGLSESEPSFSLCDVFVTFADNEGVTCKSNQIVKVPMGGNATFEFSANEGFVIQSASAGTLEEGKLTLDGIYAPTTVYLYTKRLAQCNFEAIPSDRSLGSVASSVPNGTYYEGTEVSVVAKPKAGTIFLGFSYGKPYNQGGEIVEKSREHRYTLTPDTMKVYANYIKAVVGDDPALFAEVPDGQWVLIYHPNGGTDILSLDEPYRQTTFSREFYYCPNTLPNDGTFIRDGYVLLGYNTKPDGSGHYYAPGWNVVMPEDRDAISLYCMWEEVSDVFDFQFEETAGGGLEILKYYGNDTKVVIPEYYYGHPVVKISEGAFENNDKIETVIFPRTIREISKNAFSGCTKWQTLYIGDSLKKATDQAVSNCPELKTVYVSATRYPAYAGKNHGTFAVKYEKLIASNKLKLIVVSGSNTSHGLVTPLLEETLLNAGYDFDVVNFGTIAEASVVFPLEIISHFVGEGDIVVHQPEASHDTQWGNNILDNYIWTIFESAYDAFTYVDIRNYDHFFSSFATFNSKRGKEVGYEAYSKNYVDKNGEYFNLRDKTIPAMVSKFEEYKAVGGGPLSLDVVKQFVAQHGEKLNRAYKMISDTGAAMLNSFASTADVYLSADSQIPDGEMQKMLENIVDTELLTTRISNVSTYVFGESWFYNSEYHLTTEGAKMRTALFAKDILGYLNK